MECLSTLRKLVLTYQSFEHYSAKHIRDLGFTMTQFDIIATLGNQLPMTCKVLGEKTLVTKGTLTGVLERLEGKGVIKREINKEDARSQMIGLTEEGQRLFEKVFPVHIDYLNQAFSKLTAEELDEISRSLEKLRSIF